MPISEQPRHLHHLWEICFGRCVHNKNKLSFWSAFILTTFYQKSQLVTANAPVHNIYDVSAVIKNASYIIDSTSLAALLALHQWSMDSFHENQMLDNLRRKAHSYLTSCSRCSSSFKMKQTLVVAHFRLRVQALYFVYLKTFKKLTSQATCMSLATI